MRAIAILAAAIAVGQSVRMDDGEIVTTQARLDEVHDAYQAAKEEELAQKERELAQKAQETQDAQDALVEQATQRIQAAAADKAAADKAAAESAPPITVTPAAVPPVTPATPPAEPLLDDAPLSAKITGAGFDTAEKIKAATDEQLLAIPGIGPVNLARVRELTK